MEKKSSNSYEDVEASTNDYRGRDLKRRTFAKGAGASLALASTLGGMGTGVAQLGDDSPDDDTGPDMDPEQFRQMNKELYVAALAVNQDENGDSSEGSGVAVFEAPEGQYDDDDMGVDDNDDPDVDDNDDPDVDDNDDPDVDDDNDTGNGTSAEHEVDSLDYHVFIMDADDVSRVTLNDYTSDEEVEELADLSQGVDDDMDPDDDDDNDDDPDQDNGNQQGVSGTIEEPIVVAGSLGQGAMDSDPDEDDSEIDDDDNDDSAQGDGEFDLEDFRQNPWDYYVAVHGDDDDEDSEAMLRGRVTTGLLEGEEEPGDRVSDDDTDENGTEVDDDDPDVDDDDDDPDVDDDDDNGIGDDNDTDVGDDNDTDVGDDNDTDVGDDNDTDVGDDNDTDVGDDDDDDNGLIFD